MLNGLDGNQEKTNQAVDATAYTDLDRIFAAQQAAFLESPMPSAEYRRRHLSQLKNVLLAYKERIIRAVQRRFQRPGSR